MSIFGSIMSKIFGSTPAEAAPASPPPAPSADAPAAPSADSTPAPSDTSSSAAPSAPAAAPATAPASVDVAAVLDGLEEHAGQKLDWRHSIVDLMKLLHIDSSLTARKELAQELHYTGDTNDSATMNIWLHKQVMQKLAENGGKLPPDIH